MGLFRSKFILVYLFLIYFAVAVSCSELKPTQTFTVMHEKFSP